MINAHTLIGVEISFRCSASYPNLNTTERLITLNCVKTPQFTNSKWHLQLDHRKFYLQEKILTEALREASKDITYLLDNEDVQLRTGNDSKRIGVQISF